jgi:hypothetical protein
MSTTPTRGNRQMANATATYEDVERAAQAIKTTRDQANPIQQFCGVWP